MNNIASLAASKLAAEVGFPQDEFPQMVWIEDGVLRAPGWKAGPWCAYRTSAPPQPKADPILWSAAPDLLSLLMWCETQGWRWSRGDHGTYYAWEGPNPYSKRERMTADNPQALALAVLTAMRDRSGIAAGTRTEGAL